MAASAVDKVYDAVSEGKAKNVGTPSGYAIACACVALLLCSVFVCSFVLFRLGLEHYVGICVRLEVRYGYDACGINRTFQTMHD